MIRKQLELAVTLIAAVASAAGAVVGISDDNGLAAVLGLMSLAALTLLAVNLRAAMRQTQ